MSEKITASHLRRKALLYIRQSSPQQVTNNEESRRLQYAMRDRLRTLGWKEIEVIDEDLGRSAAGSTERTGFERLVALVSLGEIGAVAAREVSRFARNSRDWQKLVEVCRYVDTVLVDQDAIYDARQGNDRLLLGLKGSLNEYELELLRLRAHEARREKARRGEYFAKIAVGYRKTEEGKLEKTPDLRVQQIIRLAFDKSLELGSARQCLSWLCEQGLGVPVNRNHRGEVRWRAPSQGWLYKLLTNPVYAGTYAYGRTALKTVLRDGMIRHEVVQRPQEEWIVYRDHHEAYVDQATFERIHQMLQRNAQARRAVDPGAAKRGAALLAGLLRCRRCGEKLLVGYSGDGSVHRYCCDRRNSDHGEPRCISFSGAEVDERIGQAVLDVVAPAAVEASLRAATERSQASDETLETLRIEARAARYEADRAGRQFDAADPENRLVVDELERRWNQALEHAQIVEGRVLQKEEGRRREAAELPPPDAFSALASDLNQIWNAPTTDVRLKKRIVRALVEEIVADVNTASSCQILLVVHWKGGVHTEFRVPKRRRGYNAKHTPPDIVEAMRLLALVCSDAEIAGWLSRAGILTTSGHSWSRALVASFRSARGIPAHAARQSTTDTWVTLQAAAELLKVTPKTIKRAVARGVLAARQPLPHGPWLFQRDELLNPALRQRLFKANSDPEVPSPKQLALGISGA